MEKFRNRSIISGQTFFLSLISTNVCARSVGWAMVVVGVCGREIGEGNVNVFWNGSMDLGLLT